jgi:hypothetical protein
MTGVLMTYCIQRNWTANGSMVAIAAEVPPAHVIGRDQNDVRWRDSGAGRHCENQDAVVDRSLSRRYAETPVSVTPATPWE